MIQKTESSIYLNLNLLNCDRGCHILKNIGLPYPWPRKKGLVCRSTKGP